MTIPTYTIRLPYPLSTLTQIELRLEGHETVEGVIRKCLKIQAPAQIIPTKKYLLMIKPFEKALFPPMPLSAYFSQLLQPKLNAEYVLLPKRLRIIKVRYLMFEVRFEVDPVQQVRAVAKKASLLLANKHISLDPKWPEWTLLDSNSNYLQFDTNIHHFLPSDEKSEPLFYLRRELARTHRPHVPIFKGTISDALSREHYKTQVPFFFLEILRLVEEKKNIEGIYRKSGLQTNIEKLAKKIDQIDNKADIAKLLSSQAPHDLSGVAKLYLRQLSVPIIPQYIAKDFSAAINDNNDIRRMQTLRMLIRALPTDHINLLHALAKHIEKVAACVETNKMNISNISTCFGPNIVRKDDSDVVGATLYGQMLIRLIFENYSFFFENDPSCLKTVGIVPNDYPGIKAGERVSIIGIDPDGKYFVDFNGKLLHIPELRLLETHDIPEISTYQNISYKIPGSLKTVPQYLPPACPVDKTIVIALQEAVEQLKLKNERTYVLMESGEVAQENLEEFTGLVTELRNL